MWISVEETYDLQHFHLTYSPEFQALAQIIMTEQGQVMPRDASGAKALYIVLLANIKDVEDSM